MGETLLSKRGILSTPVFTDVQDFRLRRTINQSASSRSPSSHLHFSQNVRTLFVGRFLRPQIGCYKWRNSKSRASICTYRRMYFYTLTFLTRRLFKGFLRLSVFVPSVPEGQSSRCMLQLHRGRGKGARARKLVISLQLENYHSSIPTWYNFRPTQ